MQVDTFWEVLRSLGNEYQTLHSRVDELNEKYGHFGNSAHAQDAPHDGWLKSTSAPVPQSHGVWDARKDHLRVLPSFSAQCDSIKPMSSPMSPDQSTLAIPAPRVGRQSMTTPRYSPRDPVVTPRSPCPSSPRFTPRGVDAAMPQQPRNQEPIVACAESGFEEKISVERPSEYSLDCSILDHSVHAVQRPSYEMDQINSSMESSYGDSPGKEIMTVKTVEAPAKSFPMVALSSINEQRPSVNIVVMKRRSDDTAALLVKTRSENTSGSNNGVLWSNLLWPVWTDEMQAQTSLLSPTFAGRTSRNGMKSVASAVRIGDVVEEEGCRQNFILRPTSSVAILWDAISIIIMAYDILTIPLSLVFSWNDGDWHKKINHITTVFWTCDMFFSMLVGFEAGGVIEMRPGRILRRYLRSWFIFDLLVVAADWIQLADSVIGTGTAGPLGILRIFKILRLARILRIVRFFRVVQMISMILEFSALSTCPSELIGIVKFIMVILLVNHYIACGWYGIGKFHPGDSTYTWLDRFKETRRQEENDFYMYSTCLHWSFCQFTPAGLNIHPETGLERAYAIAVVVSGLLVFSSFVSGITSSMTAWRRLTNEKTRQTEYVRRYITDRRVSLDLGNRIFSYLNQKGYVKEARLMEADVAAFQRLPDTLLMDLHAELFLPLMVQHPVNYHLSICDFTVLKEICHLAAREVVAGKKERMFSYGEEASLMRFVSRGCLNYHHGETKIVDTINKDEHVSEAALWLRWKYKGTLDTITASDLIDVKAADVQSILRKTSSLVSCQLYAREFAKNLSSVRYPTDKCGDFDEIQEMAQIAFEEQLQTINLEAGTTNSARRASSRFRKGFSNLIHVLHLDGGKRSQQRALSKGQL